MRGGCGLASDQKLSSERPGRILWLLSSDLYNANEFMVAQVSLPESKLGFYQCGWGCLPLADSWGLPTHAAQPSECPSLATREVWRSSLQCTPTSGTVILC